MAIGNPFRLSNTVTVGVVSAVGRPTHASRAPAASGGRLHPDRRGDQPRQLGRSAAEHPRRSHRHQHDDLTDQSGGNVGVGFAVPINRVRDLLPPLRTGKVMRGRIGVSVSRTR